MSTTTLRYGSRGERVKTLQQLLNNNPYFKPRRKLVVDGDMRTLTCGAVQQAKYRLGYVRASIRPVAGAPLLAYLDKTRPLTAKMLARRKARLAKAAAKPLRVKALAAAKADIGIVEGPNNAIKFNAWWCAPRSNDGGAYCVRAGSYWYAKAGSTAVVRGSRWENTDALLEDAKHGRGGVHLTADPDPGDGFVIDWDGHANPDHLGLYASDDVNGQFHSIEANATLANGQQGVGAHTRPANQCWFIVFER